MMSFAASLACAVVVALTACGADDRPSPDEAASTGAPVSVRDSVRARRERAMQTRPDTFGLRVDSLRVLRARPRAASATDAAPPWVVVISDFQCESCRRFGLEVVPALRRDIEVDGIANLAFVNAPQETHFNARFAALAALCAASADRFWAMHDTLFATLPRWARDADPRPFMDSLAVAVGVPEATQRDCIDRHRLLHLLDADVRRSAQAGATDLPAVYVGDVLLPPAERTIEGVRRAVARAAQGLRPATGTRVPGAGGAAPR